MSQHAETLFQTQQEFAESLNQQEQIQYRHIVSKKDFLVSFGKVLQSFRPQTAEETDVNELLIGIGGRIDLEQNNNLYIEIVGTMYENISVVILQMPQDIEDQQFPTFREASKAKFQNNAVLFAHDTYGHPTYLEARIPDEETRHPNMSHVYYIPERLKKLSDEQKLLAGTLLLDTIFLTLHQQMPRTEIRQQTQWQSPVLPEIPDLTSIALTPELAKDILAEPNDFAVIRQFQPDKFEQNAQYLISRATQDSNPSRQEIKHIRIEGSWAYLTSVDQSKPVERVALNSLQFHGKITMVIRRTTR